MTDDRFSARVELREAGPDAPEGSPGRIVATLLRYGDASGVGGTETFERGALRWPDRGIRIDVDHLSSPVKGSLQQPVALAVPFLSADGLEVRIDAPLAPTQQARDLAALMRLGMYESASVEFRNSRNRWSAGVRHVVSAELVAAALTDNPSYSGTSAEIRNKAAATRRRPLIGLL